MHRGGAQAHIEAAGDGPAAQRRSLNAKSISLSAAIRREWDRNRQVAKRRVIKLSETTGDRSDADAARCSAGADSGSHAGTGMNRILEPAALDDDRVAGHPSHSTDIMGVPTPRAETPRDRGRASRRPAVNRNAAKREREAALVEWVAHMNSTAGLTPSFHEIWKQWAASSRYRAASGHRGDHIATPPKVRTQWVRRWRRRWAIRLRCGMPGPRLGAAALHEKATKVREGGNRSNSERLRAAKKSEPERHQ